MKKENKIQKRFTIKKLSIALTASMLLMIASFGFVYLNSLSSKNQYVSSCEEPIQSQSSDGLTVINEVDVNCMTVAEENWLTTKTGKGIGFSISIISALITIILLDILLKKAR